MACTSTSTFSTQGSAGWLFLWYIVFSLTAGSAVDSQLTNENFWVPSPLSGQGTPPDEQTTVYLSVYLNRLTRVDESNYGFEASVTVALSWKDPRAQEAISNRTLAVANDGAECERPCVNEKAPWNHGVDYENTHAAKFISACCDSVWLPTFLAENAQHYPETNLYYSIGLCGAQNVNWRTTWTAVYSAAMSFHNFPFDSQQLKIEFMFYDASVAEHVTLVPSLAASREYTIGDEVSSWHVTNMYIQYDNKIHTEDLIIYEDASQSDVCPDNYADHFNPMTGELFPSEASESSFRVYLVTEITRYYWFYLLEDVTPILLTGYLAFVVFLFDVRRFAVRVEIIATLFVAVMAVQYIVNQNLPASSYIVPTQKLIIANYILYGICIVEAYGVYRIAMRLEREKYVLLGKQMRQRNIFTSIPLVNLVTSASKRHFDAPLDANDLQPAPSFASSVSTTPSMAAKSTTSQLAKPASIRGTRATSFAARQQRSGILHSSRSASLDGRGDAVLKWTSSLRRAVSFSKLMGSREYAVDAKNMLLHKLSTTRKLSLDNKALVLKQWKAEGLISDVDARCVLRRSLDGMLEEDEEQQEKQEVPVVVSQEVQTPSSSPIAPQEAAHAVQPPRMAHESQCQETAHAVRPSQATQQAQQQGMADSVEPTRVTSLVPPPGPVHSLQPPHVVRETQRETQQQVMTHETQQQVMTQETQQQVMTQETQHHNLATMTNSSQISQEMQHQETQHQVVSSDVQLQEMAFEVQQQETAQALQVTQDHHVDQAAQIAQEVQEPQANLAVLQGPHRVPSRRVSFMVEQFENKQPANPNVPADTVLGTASRNDCQHGSCPDVVLELFDDHQHAEHGSCRAASDSAASEQDVNNQRVLQPAVQNTSGGSGRPGSDALDKGPGCKSEQGPVLREIGPPPGVQARSLGPASFEAQTITRIPKPPLAGRRQLASPTTLQQQEYFSRVPQVDDWRWPYDDGMQLGHEGGMPIFDDVNDPRLTEMLDQRFNETLRDVTSDARDREEISELWENEGVVPIRDVDGRVDLDQMDLSRVDWEHLDDKPEAKHEGDLENALHHGSADEETDAGVDQSTSGVFGRVAQRIRSSARRTARKHQERRQEKYTDVRYLTWKAQEVDKQLFLFFLVGYTLTAILVFVIT